MIELHQVGVDRGEVFRLIAALSKGRAAAE